VEALETQSQDCDDNDLDGYGVGPGCLGADCDDADPDIYVGAPELCDNKDNDCDDEVDEDMATGPCDGPDADLCEEGLWLCVDGSSVCSDNTGNNEEVCNGVDDDCDDLVDENLFGSGQLCPALDCAHILAVFPGSPSGFYWIDPYGEGAWLVYCDMESSDGECGDDVVQVMAGEECDDGNTDSGDGCSDVCTWEGG
jgi:cysteine-rich repeat protein